MKVYLDNAATTVVAPEVLAAMRQWFVKDYGNPATLYSFGARASAALEAARAEIAKRIGAQPHEIVFTSGGTESNNLAIKGIAYSKGRGHIVASAIEHASVLNCCRELTKQGFKISYLPVDKDGIVKLEELENVLTKETILVTVMHANNEIGSIQPIEEIGRICSEKQIPFHTDAVQSFTKEPLDVKKANLSLVSLSAHKIHGPKGVGALFVKSGLKLKPLLQGGEQEFGIRPGTQNVAGAVGFSTAIRLVKPSHISKMRALRDRLIKRVLSTIPGSSLNGSAKKRLCNNANFSFDFIEGEALVLELDKMGVYASTGSACTSHMPEPSHVLLALGLPTHKVHSSLRLTLSMYTTKKEIDYTIEQLAKAVQTLRQRSPPRQLASTHTMK